MVSLTISTKIAIFSAGILFLTGLLTGIWKYQQMSTSDDATAHPYIDICHRTALMYSFASILVAVFAFISQLDMVLETICVLALESFFMLAVFSYLLHGILKDTDNQFKQPHQLGKKQVPHVLVTTFMIALIIAETVGFAVLFYGVCLVLLQ